MEEYKKSRRANGTSFQWLKCVRRLSQQAHSRMQRQEISHFHFKTPSKVFLQVEGNEVKTGGNSQPIMKHSEKEMRTIYTSRDAGKHNQAGRQGDAGENDERQTGGKTSKLQKHIERQDDQNRRKLRRTTTRATRLLAVLFPLRV